MAVVQVAKGDLNTWLSNQPANTIDTPYEIEITGLSASDFSAASNPIKTALSNNSSKFVDLRYTNIPDDLTDIKEIFKNCSSLVFSPILPNRASNMQGCFINCSSLKEAPVIPDTVTQLNNTFTGCSSLEDAPVIPSNVTHMEYTFANCTSLVNAPNIPNSVTRISNCFDGCSALIIAPVIGNGIQYLTQTFRNCTSLVNAPIIPDTITRLGSTFKGCTSLINAPIISNNITNMNETFSGCVSLAYKPIIPSSVTTITDCFEGVVQTCWGGSSSQIETWISEQTSEFSVIQVNSDVNNNRYIPVDGEIYGVSISNLSLFLSEKPVNTVETPYKIKILDLDTTNVTDIRTILISNSMKYVDLRRTTLPNVTRIWGIFARTTSLESAKNLVYAPPIPSSATDISDAYQFCTALKEAPTLASTLTNVANAFAGCSSLTQAPDLSALRVTSLSSMFYKCTNLESFGNIPSTVTQMGNTFEECKLTGTLGTLPSSLRQMNATFRGSKMTTAPAIPTSVYSISGAFQDCTELTTAPSIPSGTYDLHSAFSGCTSLTTAATINGTASNRDCTRMYAGCTALTNAGTIPANTTKLDYMFKDCTSLNTAATINGTNSRTVTHMYEGCTSLVTPGTIPAGTTNHSYMYSGCSALENPPTISGTTTDRNMSYMFNNCIKLTTMPVIPEGVVSLQDCFKNCADLVVMEAIPSTVTDMVEAFLNCSNIPTAPTIPSGVTSLKKTFYNCESITAPCNVPDTVESMESTFEGCTSLASVPSLGTGVTSMKRTFANCSALTDIITSYPAGVTSLEYTYTGTGVTDLSAKTVNVATLNHTFSGCSSLTDIPNIGSNVTSLQGAFSDCVGITELGVLPSVANYKEAFQGCENLENVRCMPASATDITSMFEGCSSLEVIEECLTPLSVIESEYAENCFKDCSSLVRIGSYFEPVQTTDWHVYLLKFGTTTVEGKIFGIENNQIVAVTIPQTTIDKTDLLLPIMNDELWFPDGTYSDAAVETTISNILTSRYGYYNKTAIPPDQKSFVMYADDPNNVVSNFLNGGGSGSGIKVYDTEDDIISDLPNLKPLDVVAYKASKDPKSGVPLGTWASFENDSAPNGEWLGAGAFDPNTYPALAMMLGGNTVPERFDKSRLGDIEEFTVGTGSANATTIERDGVLMFSFIRGDGASSQIVPEVYINNTRFGIGATDSTASYHFDKATATFPVKKGDVVYKTQNWSNSGSTPTTFFRPYSHPLFIKATPTSSDSDYEGTLNVIRTYVENNAVRTKVWIKQKNTTAQAINLVGIVIPNASKVTSLGFATIHRAGQYDPMQYYFVDLPNTSSFVMGIGEFNVNPTINGTYDSTNDTWTITSVSGVSSTYWCQFCANYGQQIIETN